MIVDANVHVTSDGRWFDTSVDASVDTLLGQLDEAGVERAVVVGLPGQTTNDEVLAICARHPDRLLPVGSFDPAAHEDESRLLAAARAELKDHGLLGFKLHPRLGGYDPLDPRVETLLEEVASWDPTPPVWLCTLLHSPRVRLGKPPVETIHQLVDRHPALTFVLAHGGGADLLALASAVRASPNAFVELSYTLTHFAGSSVEQDIAWLMHTFERRVMFGSDFPEWRVGDALSTLQRLLADVPSESAARVLGGNLAKVLGNDA